MTPLTPDSERYILCCNCPDMPAFSKDAFTMLFPGQPVPEVYAGHAAIYSLFKAHPDEGDFSTYVHSLYRNKGKFSYLLERLPDRLRVINLKKGVEVA